MKTAVDTSVLIAITKGEPTANAWVELLADARHDGELVICDIVAAELAALLGDAVGFRRVVRDLGIVFDPVSLAAAQRAGRIFRSYRDHGGPREHLVPDFLVAAHAIEQAGRIAAVDRGYLRRYFPRLVVLRPHS